MSPQAIQRFELLKQLARYDDAYKRALKFASINSDDGVADLTSPFYDLVKYYKGKIKHIRLLIRSS